MNELNTQAMFWLLLIAPTGEGMMIASTDNPFTMYKESIAASMAGSSLIVITRN